jgi:hypothetical protein
MHLENIMQQTLNNFQTSVSIGSRPICNLHFVDDIDLMAEKEIQLHELTTKLENVIQNWR